MGLFVVFRRKIIVIQALSLLCSGPFGPVFRPGGRPTRGLVLFRACTRNHPEYVVRKERGELLRLRLLYRKKSEIFSKSRNVMNTKSAMKKAIAMR